MTRRTVEHRAAADDLPALEVQRSSRRRVSASAYSQDGHVVVQLPAGLTPPEEERLIRQLVKRVTGRQRAESLGGDAALARRAAQLADRYLDGVHPASIRWVDNMRRRFASCTPADGSIRVSREVAAFPAYVRDYLLVHELAHLRVPDHRADFDALVARYPQAERARGFLEGVRFLPG